MYARSVQLAALLAGLSGLSAYFAMRESSLGSGSLSRAAAGAVFATLVLLFIAGLAISADGEETLAGQWRQATRAATRLGLPLAPLALLPFEPHSTVFAAAVIAVAVIGCIVVAGPRAFAGIPERPHARGRALGPWEASVLAFCVLVGLLYVRIAARTDGNFQNDSAYYFGVAKHIAATGRFESPIVWQFLRKPASVPAAPFDYWGGATSVVLVPFLALFGRTQQVADIVMGGVSGGAVFLFGYLVAVRRVVRNRLVGGALVVAFAFAPALHTCRFDTETIPLYHLVVLLALLLALQKRWAWASLCAGLLYHVRPDALFVALAFWGWALYEAFRSGKLKRVVLVQAAVLAATLGYGALAFGAPLGVRAEAVRLKSQLDLYQWNHHPQLPLLASRLDRNYLAARLGQIVQALARITPGGTALLALIVAAGALPGEGSARSWRREGLALWCLGLPCAVLVGLASGPMFVPWRTLHPFIPLVLLGAGRSLDSLLELLGHWHVAPAWTRRGAALGLVGLVLVAMLRPVSLYGLREHAVIHRAELELRKLDPLLRGQVVASNLPWYVIANTRSPAVNIPTDGFGALQQVLARYHVRWIVIVGTASGLRASAAAFPRRRDWNVGRFHMQQRLVAGGLRLIRVAGPERRR